MKMKTSVFLFFLTFISILILPVTVNATNIETEEPHSDEILINGNRFEGQKTGSLNVTVVDVPNEVESDIYVMLANAEKGETYLLNLFKSKGYKDYVQVPVGTYQFFLAGVTGDGIGKYPLSYNGKEIVVSENKASSLILTIDSSSTYIASGREDEEAKEERERQEEAKKKEEERIKKEQEKQKMVNSIILIAIVLVIGIVIYLIKKARY